MAAAESFSQPFHVLVVMLSCMMHLTAQHVWAKTLQV